MACFRIHPVCTERPGWRSASRLLILIVSLLAAPLAAGEPVRLTTDGLTKFTAAFCNNGREIVYVDFIQGATYRLQRLNLATGKVERQHPKASTSEFEPAFSADGRYLRLPAAAGPAEHPRGHSQRGDRFGHRSVARSGPGGNAHAGSGAGRLAGRLLVCRKESPAALFGRYAGRRPSAADRQRRHQHRPVLFAGRQADRLLLDARRQLRDLRDGCRRRERRAADRQPVSGPAARVSPDGQRIAFTSHRDGNAEIYVMNADGTEPRRITEHPERDDYPAWHPDGRRLLVVSERDGQHDLYLVDVDR